MQLTTPALLFPAISLLLLAYTSRFLALAQLTRTLHEQWQASHNPLTNLQIALLRKRIALIRSMQLFGVVSFALCTASMLLLLIGSERLGEYAFGISLVSLLFSLILSLREVSASTKALYIQLDSMQCAE
jgi:hypothetical protein